MSVHILPQTKAGKWAVGLVIVWLALMVFGPILANGMYQGVPAGNSITEDIRLRPLLAISMLTGITAGLVACGLNLVAIVRQRERSIISILTFSMGLLLVLLVVGEFLVPNA